MAARCRRQYQELASLLFCVHPASFIFIFTFNQLSADRSVLNK